MSQPAAITEERTFELKGRYGAEIAAYVNGMIDGSIPANEDRILGAKRFVEMCSSGRYELKYRDADLVISLIEAMFKHRKGQKLDGTPIKGQPFLLEPWEKFCIYGMLIFYFPGTRERVVKEALIFIPRTNVLKEATKAYTNKLVIGITTAGDDGTSFCAQRVEYSRKILNGLVRDDSLFIFLCCADRDKETGDIDFTNPEVHQKANPNYGITIRPADILRDAMEALNDPQQRKDFLAKSLNVFVSAINSYFDIEEFRRSNTAARAVLGFEQYEPAEEKLRKLAKLPIKWYGGADLSKMHDLTATALYGEYKGVEIIIPHCWFPVTAAQKKADEDNIPLFGWKDDGWLDMIGQATNDPETVVLWFTRMKQMGFKIARVAYDRKYGEKFFKSMRKAGFRVVDQPQYFWRKSVGFRQLEYQAKNKKLYYLEAEPFEYCVQNVSAIEQTDDMIKYEKVQPNHRIDIFEAAVFAACCKLESEGKAIAAEEWVGAKKT